jgi:hypothetical protein
VMRITENIGKKERKGISQKYLIHKWNILVKKKAF